MEAKAPRRTVDVLADAFQTVLNAALVFIALVLSYMLFREIWFILKDVMDGNTNVHDTLEKVLAFFLYFAFVSTVIKYFREGNYFPVRYLLYIGITATIRFLIVNRDNPMENLILSGVVLLLLAGYLMIRSDRKA